MVANRPGDTCGDAIRSFLSLSATSSLSLSDLRFGQRLGAGDIGSVYLAELKQPQQSQFSEGTLTKAYFAAKLMNKEELAARDKEGPAKTEREILQLMEHPFLPNLYAFIDSQKFGKLMEILQLMEHPCHIRTSSVHISQKFQF